MTLRRRIAVLLLFLMSACFLRQGQRYDSFTVPVPLAPEGCLVLGILGGRARWDADNRWVRKTALALRERGVPVETVENSKKNLAMRLLRKAFDSNGDGSLDAREKHQSRLIIYGHSFGGAAAVELARRLQEQSIPVRLLVRIDSVGFRDKTIPANVSRVAALYQRNGWFVRGETALRLEDAARTSVLGNWRYDYSDKAIDVSDLSWFKRLFQTAHLKMGNDPEMWAKVDELITAELERSGC